MEMCYFIFRAILVCVSITRFSIAAELLNATFECGYQTDILLDTNEQRICPNCREDGWEYINETESVARHCRKLCDVSKPDCEISTTCTELSTNFSACICADGYTLSQFGRCTESDVDECKSEKSLCAENQKCINSPGSYSCECIDGATNCHDKGTEAGSPPGKDKLNYTLIGGIVGGAILVALIVIIIVYWQRAKKRRSERIKQAKLEAGKVQSEASEHDYANPGSDVTNLQDEAEVDQQMHTEEESQDVVPELDAGDVTKANQNLNRISDLYSNHNIVKKK